MAEKREKRGRTARAIILLLLSPIIILWVLFVLLYIPSVQKFAVEKICEIVDEKSDYNISIGDVSLSFPLTLTINDFILSNSGDTLLDGKQIGINIRAASLLRGKIEVNYISIDQTEVHTHNLIDGITIEGNVGHIRTTIRSIDPLKEVADIRLLHIADTHANITITEKSEESEDSTSAPLNWLLALRRSNIHNLKVNLTIPADTFIASAGIERLQIKDVSADLGEKIFELNKFSLDKSRISYDIGSESDSIAPLMHQNIENIGIEGKNLKYSPTDITAEISRLTLAQRKGMRIKKGNLSLTADTDNIYLHKATIATANGSTINATAQTARQISDAKDKREVSGKIKLHIDKRDLGGFIAKETYKKLSFLPDSMLNATMMIHGNTHNIYIDTLHANIPSLSQIGICGEIHNLHNVEEINADIDIKGFISDLDRIISLRHNIDSLSSQTLMIAGRLSMIQKECSLALRMRAGNGYAAIRAGYNTDTQAYNAQARIKELKLSNILPDIPLHNLTMSLWAKGAKFDLFSPLTHYSCRIKADSIIYDTISLNHITLTAEQRERLSKITAATDDPKIRLNLNATTHIDSSAIRNNSHLILKEADLYAIGLTNSPMSASLALNIGASTDTKETHEISITGDSIQLQTRQKRFTPARLEISGMTSPDSSFLKLKTGDLKIDGTLGSGYRKLSAAIERLAAMYNEAKTSESTIYYAQDFERILPAATLEINCGESNILANFLRFNKIEFSGMELDFNFDSINGINGKGGIYNLKRDNMQIDTINVLLNQQEEKIRYFAGLRTRSLDPQQKKLKFYSALFGTLHNDSITTNFIFRDNNDNVATRISSGTLLKPEGIDLRFTPQATLFNRPFSFNNDNYLSLRKNMAIRGDIELKDAENSGLRIYTGADTTQLRDISLELYNVDLQAVTRLIPYAPNITGILNMDLHYNENNSNTIISSDIRGTDIVYENTPIGNETIEISYFPKNKEIHYLDITLHHNEEQIFNLYGDFINDSISPRIDSEATITHFPLQLTDAFIKESGLKLYGHIDGNLSIAGSLDNCTTDGSIRFDSVYADAPIYGTKLHLKDDKIEIDNNKLQFNNFDIYAHSSTPFQINGDIDITNISNPYINLRMNANGYELVNAKRDKSSMLYGRLFLDINSMIYGRTDALQINGRATLLGNSDITYVIQESPLATESELDGLVKFVNFADTTQIADSERESVDFGNLTMNLTLSIEEGARINADFDENRNSYIQLQGGGNLNLTYTGETGMNLTGRYTLNDGQLKYTLPIIPLKTFNISDGSYVNWTGDILNPTLNIIALERMRTSVTMNDGTSQAVAFDVGVELTNTLENMGLSFTLSAPENAEVQNQLNSLDKETLNKYAVTMLVTGAYLGGNNGITVSSAISSFLDARINDIAGNAMKSVDINVGITDIENSETGNTYKNYSFSFAKRFWNDRLTVVIGGEVNSGDTYNRNESFINNVSLEWKLSNEGNRYLRLFYDKNYESILEGEIIETGIGYVYKRKLNKLKELFIFRKKDDKEQLILVPQKKENNSKK